MRLGGGVGLWGAHRGQRGLVVRRGGQGSTVVVGLDGHDGVGPDLTQLPLLLPPLPVPKNINTIIITIIIIPFLLFSPSLPLLLQTSFLLLVPALLLLTFLAVGSLLGRYRGDGGGRRWQR